MPSSDDDKLIEDAVQDFSRELLSDLPLRHFGEFHDPEKLKDVAEQQKQNVFRKLFDKIWTRDKEEIVSLMRKLYRRMDQEVITAWLTKNQDHEIKSISFLQKWVDMICEDFNAALEDQLLLNPDMELESFKNYIKSRKLFAASCFDRIWKPGNAQIQEERKSKFEKHIKGKEQEVLEKQELHLQRKLVEKGKSLLGEVRTILLEKSRQLKSYVVKNQGHVSTAVLKGTVEEIGEYLLNGKASTLRGSHEEIHIKLVTILENEIKSLAEKSKENMTVGDVVGYAERFDDKLRSCFFDDATDNAHAQEIQQEDTNRRDPNEEPRRWTTMQEILKELKEEQWKSLDSEVNELNGSAVEETNEGNNVGGVEAGQTARGKARRITPSTCLPKRSANGTDLATIISVTAAPDVPPSKKLETGCGAARKITRRVDGGSQRRSSRLNRATAGYSISAPTQTPFPRRKNPHTKEMRNVDPTILKMRRSDVEKTAHSNCENDDISQEDSMMNSPSSTPPSSKANMGSKGNEDRLEGSQQKPKKSKYDVSRRTRKTGGRNGGPGASSEQPQLNGKSRQAKKPYRRGGEVCPKYITVLKGTRLKYSCNVCKKKLMQKRYLKYHGEFCGTAKSRPFICDECGKRFHYKVCLVMHTQIHRGEKPFLCPQCPERFKRKDYLQSHIRCHKNGSPYSCKVCNLTFVSHQGLHEHNLSHEGLLPLSCNHCGKRFNRMSKLKNHVIVHADERPFECLKCKVFFLKMECLLSHFQHAHSQPRRMAHKLAYDAAVAYLLKETKKDSCREIPVSKINAAVVNHVIKKANLLIPNAQ